jgi:hypothetical protein
VDTTHRSTTPSSNYFPGHTDYISFPDPNDYPQFCPEKSWVLVSSLSANIYLSIIIIMFSLQSGHYQPFYNPFVKPSRWDYAKVRGFFSVLSIDFNKV